MRRLKEDIYNYLCTLLVWTALTAGLVALVPRPVHAAGTAAATTIANTALVSFTLGSDPTPLTVTASDSFEVLEVIDVVLVWQDAANVPVNSPHSDRILTFVLTNTGNGPEGFDLTAVDALGGDQFDPAIQSLWIETNGTAGLQSDDTLYTGSLTLAADEAVLVYALSNIPAGYGDGDRGDLQVNALASTPGAAGQDPGTELVGAGVSGVAAVVGATRAEDQAVASYAVATASVDLVKSIARIADLQGGDRPSSGARVTYRILVDVAGSGIAQGLVVADPIPADMSYVAGSMRLDGVPQTDNADADNGDFNGSAANTVTVVLNDSVAPATRIIEFDTIINP